MKVKEFLARYDVGEEFNEKELQEIFWLDFEEDEDDTCHVIEEEYDHPRHWSRNHTEWVNINECFFELNADEGLTELQDTNYWEQPKEVNLTQVTRTITVTENQWTYMERSKS
jgi:hypothetical protein